ncbi:hypothetical protein WN943_028121 [Citrus x changshan-huyou]
MITHVSNENDEGPEIILTIEKMTIRITQKQEQEEKLDKKTVDAAKLVLVVSLIPKKGNSVKISYETTDHYQYIPGVVHLPSLWNLKTVKLLSSVMEMQSDLNLGLTLGLMLYFGPNYSLLSWAPNWGEFGLP